MNLKKYILKICLISVAFFTILFLSPNKICVNAMDVTIGSKIVITEKYGRKATVPGMNLNLIIEYIEMSKDTKVVWKSSNTEVATVDQTGKVTAKKAGSVTITATTEDGIYKDTYDIIIENDEISSIGQKIVIKEQNGEKEMVSGSTLNLIIEYIEMSKDTKVVWKSSNTEVATVDQTGKVTAKKAGSVTITATTENGSHTDDYEIEVVENVEINGVNKNIKSNQQVNNNLTVIYLVAFVSVSILLYLVYILVKKQ